MLFEREDWKLFRNIETLPQKAGVPKDKLSLLVCKELTDNALDVCGECEISFSLGQMEIDPAWAKLALQYAQGQTYQGKTSPYWYTSENFFELFQAYSGSVRELIAQFDGCSKKAGKLSRRYPYGAAAASLTFADMEALLAELRTLVTKTNPERLGLIGELEYWKGYYRSCGTFTVESVRGVHEAEIPFVVEAYADFADEPQITFCSISPR